jgi:GH25 family lysozyme M1 (1,4-beta-N-acetylmuramidase)
MRRMKACDVSKWNYPVDFFQLKAEGYELVFIRGGDGYYEDERVREYVAKAHAAGLWVCIYWFFRPNLNWQTQADKLLALLREVPYDLPPTLDVETTAGILPTSRVLGWVKNWLDYVAAKLVTKPHIYTNLNIWQQIGGLVATWAIAYDVWLAQWPYDNRVDVARIIDGVIEAALNGQINASQIKPWGDPRWWQITSKGNTEAVGGTATMDIDVSRDDRSAVISYYALTVKVGHTVPITLEETAKRLYALETWAIEHGYRRCDMEFSQFLVIGLLIESIVNTIKPLYDKEKGWNVDALIALAVSVIACVGVGIDLFAVVGLPMQVPFLGSVLTGIMLSRGSNIIHDLINLLGSVRAKMLS